MSLIEPGAAAENVVCHSRNAYLPMSLPSRVAFHELPPSEENATSLMPLPESKAMPRAVSSRPTAIVAPEAWLVTNERTVNLLIGIVAVGAVPGATEWVG